MITAKEMVLAMIGYAFNVAEISIEFNGMFLSESFIEDFINNSTVSLAKAIAANLQRETEN